MEIAKHKLHKNYHLFREVNSILIIFNKNLLNRRKIFKIIAQTIVQNIRKMMLSKKDKPSAIFAMSGTIALGVMKAAEEKACTIPDDISLMGFDDSVFLDYLSTPLTTIAQPVEQISEIAVNAIIDHIDGVKGLSEWSNKMMDTQIIKRKSISVK